METGSETGVRKPGSLETGVRVDFHRSSIFPIFQAQRLVIAGLHFDRRARRTDKDHLQKEFAFEFANAQSLELHNVSQFVGQYAPLVAAS